MKSLKIKPDQLNSFSVFFSIRYPDQTSNKDSFFSFCKGSEQDCILRASLSDDRIYFFSSSEDSSFRRLWYKNKGDKDYDSSKLFELSLPKSESFKLGISLTVFRHYACVQAVVYSPSASLDSDYKCYEIAHIKVVHEIKIYIGKDQSLRSTIFEELSLTKGGAIMDFQGQKWFLDGEPSLLSHSFVFQLDKDVSFLIHQNDPNFSEDSRCASRINGFCLDFDGDSMTPVYLLLDTKHLVYLEMNIQKTDHNIKLHFYSDNDSSSSSDKNSSSDQNSLNSSSSSDLSSSDSSSEERKLNGNVILDKQEPFFEKPFYTFEENDISNTFVIDLNFKVALSHTSANESNEHSDSLNLKKQEFGYAVVELVFSVESDFSKEKSPERFSVSHLEMDKNEKIAKKKLRDFSVDPKNFQFGNIEFTVPLAIELSYFKNQRTLAFLVAGTSFIKLKRVHPYFQVAGRKQRPYENKFQNCSTCVDIFFADKIQENKSVPMYNSGQECPAISENNIYWYQYSEDTSPDCQVMIKAEPAQNIVGEALSSLTSASFLQRKTFESRYPFSRKIGFLVECFLCLYYDKTSQETSIEYKRFNDNKLNPPKNTDQNIKATVIKVYSQSSTNCPQFDSGTFNDNNFFHPERTHFPLNFSKCPLFI